ncbi:MAG TPA: class I SAM-dependent methyltransferase, partial [Candidatus Tectomicrobia bacterium]
PQPHIPRLVSLIEQLSGIGKDARIVEVGCNDGTFLAALMEAGYRNVVGIEPAQDAVNAARRKGMEVVHGYFNLDAAQGLVSAHGKFDLLITRQVLEHVTPLKDFSAGMRVAIRLGGYALIEVPNFDFSLKANDYSAIWEEHVNHFTVYTMNRFYSDGGFRMVHSETAPFCGEALITIAEHFGAPAVVSADLLRQGRDSAIAYRDFWPEYRKALGRFLGTYRDGRRRVAVYGAGCRACCLINFAGLAPYIDAVLDDQPEKQGKYMPGSHLPIIPGENLDRDHYDLCMLAVNAENEHKVIAKHRDYQENGGQFVSLLPPSNLLLKL